MRQRVRTWFWLGADDPGFENGVIGKVAGDEFTLQLKFPDGYHSEELAGAEVEFELKLNTVSEQSLPEVNENFFKSFGVEEVEWRHFARSQQYAA